MLPREPIPAFSSYEVGATFWDTHDMSDYWDELNPHAGSSRRNAIQEVTVRLDPETFARVQQAADRAGGEPIALLCLWIIARLNQAHHPQSA